MESSLQFQQEFEARLLPPWLGSRRRIGAGFASVAWGGFKLLAKVSTAVAVRQVTWEFSKGRAGPPVLELGLGARVRLWVPKEMTKELELSLEIRFGILEFTGWVSVVRLSLSPSLCLARLRASSNLGRCEIFPSWAEQGGMGPWVVARFGARPSIRLGLGLVFLPLARLGLGFVKPWSRADLTNEKELELNRVLAWSRSWVLKGRA
ncbi:unnamed protein product [Prunus armeniaca]